MRAAALVLVAVAGCDWSLHRMVDQARCERDEASPYFANGRCNQLPPSGTVPFGEVFPARATPRPRPSRALVARGRDRFDIFCAPCHGALGVGRSQVAENMRFRPPPSLHEPEIRRHGDQHYFQVISEGFGLMPSYAAMLPPDDRWAVVAWVRVLQLSQDVPLEALPAAAREEAAPWLR
jgi:mono/diheme cytochrome c family protein